MINYQGFSLTEVLVCLLIISGASLALLRQQWQLNQSLNQQMLYSLASLQIDNSAETIQAGLRPGQVEKPFQLKQSELNQAVLLELSWRQAETTLTIQRKVGLPQ